MTDAELWAAWRLWIVIAAVVVVLAAGLLIAILVTARRILAEAVRALTAAETIRANTQAIWGLQATNEVAGRMLATAEDIAKKGGALAEALQGTTVGGRRAE
jgi:hypothetical protein